MIVMMFPSNEQCENKPKARRSYNLPMNEDEMNWWIMNLRLVVLAEDWGWLNESDRFTWAWRDCIEHHTMRKMVEQGLTRKRWTICLTPCGYAKWDVYSIKGSDSK